MYNQRLAETVKFTGAAAENTSGTASAWVNAAHCDRVCFLVASSAASLAVTVEQATDGTGTAAKAATFEVVTNAATGAVVGEATATEDTVAGVLCFEVYTEQLDLNGGFTHVQASIAAGAGNVAIVVAQDTPREKPAFRATL